VRSLSGDPLMKVEIETLVLEQGGLGKDAGTQEPQA
jgi:hypothetical protein